MTWMVYRLQRQLARSKEPRRVTIPSSSSPSLGADPLEQLSRAERRRWYRAGRRIQQAHERQQLGVLRAVAATAAELHDVSTVDGDGVETGPVVFTVGERRLLGRVSVVARSGLERAMRSGPVRLGGAGRYGPYWTLSFTGIGAPLVILAARVVLLPRANGSASDHHGPVLALAG
jgi:hypothetical protein